MKTDMYRSDYVLCHVCFSNPGQFCVDHKTGWARPPHFIRKVSWLIWKLTGRTPREVPGAQEFLRENKGMGK